MKFFLTLTLYIILCVLASAISTKYLKLEKEFVIALITALFAAFRLQQGYLEDKERDREARLHSEKAKAYASLFNFINDTFGTGKLKKNKNENKMLIDLIHIRRELLAWGNSNTIIAFNRLIEASQQSEKESTAEYISRGGKALGSLILQMRKDLGLQDKGLSNLDIFSMFLDADAKKQVK